MNDQTLVLIAAHSADDSQIIGVDGRMPWDVPKDLARFRRLTIGETVIMGRKTFNGIMDKLGRPLPHRKNIVLSRSRLAARHPGVKMVSSLAGAMWEARSDEVYIAGGASVYEQFMQPSRLALLDRLEISEIQKTVDATGEQDVSQFPRYKESLVDVGNLTLTDKTEEDDVLFLTYRVNL